MGRYYSLKGKKTEAESLPSITIFSFKKHGFLEDCRCGGMESRHSWHCSPIGFGLVTTIREAKYIFIRYCFTEGGQRFDYGYRILLDTTPCNYGGERYWFKCYFCGRRVGVLYLSFEDVYHGYFCCRHCNDLTYSCRNSRYGTISSIFELDTMEKEIRKRGFFYKGKATKKYIRFLRKQEKLLRAAASLI